MKNLKCRRKKKVIAEERKPVIIPVLLIELLKLQLQMVRVKADNQYIIVSMCDRAYGDIRFCMLDIKPLLDTGMFFFGHRSHYINLLHVKCYGKHHNGLIVEMYNGDIAYISYDFKDTFIAIVENIKRIKIMGVKNQDN